MSFKKSAPTDKPAMYLERGGTQTGQPALVFDVEQFDEILNRPDLLKSERHAALHELWQLVAMFIDVGWKVQSSPPHQADNNGNSGDASQKSAICEENMVSLGMLTLMEDFIASTQLDKNTKG